MVISESQSPRFRQFEETEGDESVYVPITTSTSGSPAMRVMASERSVKPPEHPAMRMARLVSLEGDIFGLKGYNLW